MSKILVVTGKVKTFLITPQGQEIQAFRPTVVSPSSFISNMFAQGKLKQATSCELKDETTDKDFAKVFNSAAIVKKAAGDVAKQEKFAIEEFLKKFAKSDDESEPVSDSDPTKDNNPE